MATILMLAAPLAILAPLSYLSPKLEDIAWSYATWSVETAGPTFTKLAQWASTRADLFPAEFVGRFSKLQDATEGHSWEHTDTTLRQSLGDNYSDIINLDPNAKPIGSGCIAQVYKATLKQSTSLFPSGTELAIKVQHPRIRDKVLVDFYILHKFASILERIPFLNLDYLSIQDSVLQFRQIMIPQLDMRNEARNLTRFLRDFSSDESITFPQPLHELTSEHVLVEKFMHGNYRFLCSPLFSLDILSFSNRLNLQCLFCITVCFYSNYFDSWRRRTYFELLTPRSFRRRSAYHCRKRIRDGYENDFLT
jgi:aarF domain-containing kinase